MFVGEVLEPFGARFSERFRPVAVHGINADGDTVVVLWDGESTRGDGKPYENAYAWFMRLSSSQYGSTQEENSSDLPTLHHR